MKLRTTRQRRWQERGTQISKTLIASSFWNHTTRTLLVTRTTHEPETRWSRPSSLSPLFFGNESWIYNQAVGQSLTCDKNESHFLWTNFQGKDDLKIFWGQKWSARCLLFGIFRMGSSWLVDACLLHFDFLNITWQKSAIRQMPSFSYNNHIFFHTASPLHQHMVFWEWLINCYDLLISASCCSHAAQLKLELFSGKFHPLEISVSGTFALPLSCFLY